MVTTDPLEDALGCPPPPAVAGLPVKARKRLATQIQSAKHRQREEVDAAVERALHGVPLPVRGVVKKAVSG